MATFPSLTAMSQDHKLADTCDRGQDREAIPEKQFSVPCVSPSGSAFSNAVSNYSTL